MRLLIPLITLLFLYQPLVSQNLLNTSTWTVGSGSVSGYSQNGSTSENWRILGEDHLGEETILWEARNDASSGPDGGWNSSYKTIDNEKTYRFSVWIKKTNSESGTTYFGCRRIGGILKLNGSLNNNPYFWYGDLPLLDRWYLLVGYVHKKTYSSQTNLGAIYDGVTGEEVTDLRRSVDDFKFSSSATSVAHRAYLYYDTNVENRQYFMKPRLDEVNGQEPSINELLDINEDSYLTFEYDAAGNQTKRFYCPYGFCYSSSKKQFKDEELTENSKNQLEDGAVTKDNLELEQDDEITSVELYPNPTSGEFHIELGDRPSLTSEISIYDVNGRLISSYSNETSNVVRLNISSSPIGVYIVHVHFSDGDFITKRIIKN